MEISSSQPPTSLPKVEFLRRVWLCVRDLADDEVLVLASAIAFNALLSFFPFLILLLSVCRSLLQWRGGYNALLFLLRSEYLPIGQDFIARNLDILIGQSYGRVELFSVIALVFTASGVFIPVENALNRAWKFRSTRSYLRRQLLIMLLVVVCGLIALAATALASVYLAIASSQPAGIRDDAVVRLLFSLGLKIGLLPVACSTFFVIYYFLPARRIPITQVLQASIFTGLVWEIAKYIFHIALPALGFHTVYGPFQITVTLVVWAYISALLLLLGANLSAQDLLSAALSITGRESAPSGADTAQEELLAPGPTQRPKNQVGVS